MTALPSRHETPRQSPHEGLVLPQHLFREADRVVLSRYAPPGVLVDADLQILQFRGKTSRYLEPAPGSPTTDLLKMAREGLLGELKTTIRAANEEIQSSNEELQSTNQELETAKEELQSSNEELTTLNDELLARNAELGLVSNDLANLLSSIEIPIIILAEDFRIRRFSVAAERVVT